MLRKILFISIFSLFFIQSHAQFKGGFYAGINGTQVDGDRLAGFYKLGANLAVSVEYPLGEHMGLSMEIAYTQKGSQTKWQQGVPRQYFLKLDYVEVPFMLNYHDNKKVTLSAGFGVNELVHNYEELNNYNPTQNLSNIQGLTKTSVEFKAGGSYKLANHWLINVLYSYSVTSIGISDSSPYLKKSMYNNLVTFRLGYMIKGMAEKK
ncbi:MAG: porin family protein [Bacteroidota bacterium]